MRANFLVRLFVLLLLPLVADAQFYDSGQERFMRLSQIKTNKFQIIYPTKHDSVAQLFANYISATSQSATQTLLCSPKRVPITLRTTTAIANGEVAWAPRRMNVFVTAPSLTYSQPWLQQLALHEYRHVVQTSKVETGNARFFRCLFGEQFTGLLLGWHVPFWFVEGDAVMYETAASTTGRGRSARFTSKLAAQVSNKGIYSYQKAMFGSFRDFVPDRYYLGYQIVADARACYGDKIWNDAMQMVANHPISLRAFQRGIKSVSGLKEDELYKQSLQHLVDSNNCNVAQPISMLQSKEYQSHVSPTFVNGKIIAMRNQLSDIPAIVQIDSVTQTQKVLTHIGATDNLRFSQSKNLIVWNQFRFRRWDHTNHSQIWLYNIDKHRKSVVARKGRYYGSVLSPNATEVASIQLLDNLQYAIAISSVNGTTKKILPLPGLQPTCLAWTEQNDQIAFIAVGNAGKLINVIDTENQTVKCVVDSVFDDIDHLLYYKGHLLFTGTMKGVPVWYKMPTDASNLQVVAKGQFELGAGSVCADTLVFSTYTADGYKPCFANLTHCDTVDCVQFAANETQLSKVISAQEEQVQFKEDSVFASKPYCRLTHLFNIHSWGPLSVRVDAAEIGPGLTFMSQDALCTSFLTAGYQRYVAEQIDDFFANYTYKGFFPLLGIRYDYRKLPYSVTDQKGIDHIIDAKQNQLACNVEVPFMLHTSAYNVAAQFSAEYQLLKTELIDNQISKSASSTMQIAKYSALFYAQRRLAHRDLQPRWGVAVRGTLLHNLATDEGKNQLSVQTVFYAPGLGRNHGLKLYFAHQRETGETDVFMNQILYPSGCAAVSNSTMSTIQVSYAMPVCYPDLSVGKLLYVKRLKAVPFAGYCATEYKQKTSWMASAGCDLTFNLHVYRFPVPFEIGSRCAYRFATNDYYVGLLLSMNLSSLYSSYN